MAILYVTDNYITLTTLSAVSSEDSIYVKENLYNKRQSKPFRFTGAGAVGAPETILLDMGASGIEPDVVSLLNHELTGTSIANPFSLILRASAVNPPVDGWLVNAAGFNHTLTYHAQNIWDEIAPGGAFRYWRLDVIDPDNPSVAGIGEFVLYVSGTFTRNYDWGYKEGIQYISGAKETHYGQLHRGKKAKRKIFSVRFENFTDADLIAEAEAFFEALDGENPFVFIPEDSDTICWYMDCLNDFEARRKFIDTNGFTLELQEQSRGITLL